jgi:hypothetical protein
LTFQTRGSGNYVFSTGGNSGTVQAQIAHTASAVNFVQVTGAATSPGASALANILFTGSDAGVNAAIITKGTGYIAFAGNSSTSNQAFRINTTNATNTGVLLQVQGAVSGNTPVVSAISGSSNSDANIPVTFQSKGTGAINLAPGSSGVNISNGGTVTAITRTAAGSGYTSLPAIAVSAPTTAGGVTATATASGLALVGSTAVVSGGTGYTVGDTLTLAGFTGTAPTFTVTTVSAGVVTAITAVSGGNFTAAPASPASVTGGTGTGATISFSAGVLATFTITNAGSGYVEQPTVTFSGGGGSGAAAFATIGSATSLKSLSDMTVNLPSGPVLSMTDSSLPGSGAYLNLSNGSSSNAIQRAAGTATNIGVFWLSKGTSGHSFSTNNSTATEQFRVTHTASAVNFVQVTGSATTFFPGISAQGSDANIGMTFSSKGVQALRFNTNASEQQFRITHTGSAVNFIQVTGNIAGSSPRVLAEGSDTNIDLTLTPKGTGKVRFGTYTGTVLTPTGYVEIKDSSGTIRRLLVG